MILKKKNSSKFLLFFFLFLFIASIVYFLSFTNFSFTGFAINSLEELENKLVVFGLFNSSANSNLVLPVDDNVLQISSSLTEINNVLNEGVSKQNTCILLSDNTVKCNGSNHFTQVLP